MTPELTALALAGLLYAIQFGLVSVPANRELGTEKTLAPRDDGPLIDKVSVPTARLGRALDNMGTALAFFATAVVVVTLGEATGPLTAALAWLFLAARVAYVPAYRFGWVPWRSVFFGIGWLATVLMLLAALL